MNSPLLSSELTTLETKICDKMMVIRSYFKDELQLLKKYYYAFNSSMCNCTEEREPPKKPKLERSCITYEASKVLPFYLRNFIQVSNISSKHWILVLGEKFVQINICDFLVTNGKYPQNLIKSIPRITNSHGSVL